ncbi:SixA phosphatase family protein [Flavobacteriaceae bacterium LMO-SS05]
MKNIVLVRHAKSSWDHHVSDDKRPLANRGIADAHLVSQKFKAHSYQPDRIFSSPANRALSTCNIFLKNLEISDIKLALSPELYDFSGEKVVDFIKSIDKPLNNVIIFGHNYAFTSVANRFGNVYIDNVPTCGLVWIQFDVDTWNAIDKGTTKLIIRPKDLKL